MIESMKSQNQKDIELLEHIIAHIFSQNIMSASYSDPTDDMEDVCIV